MDRRTFIHSSATAATALMMAHRVGAASPALAQTTGSLGALDKYGTPRASKLRPGQVVLAHGDMHNHTLWSDGDGDAANAFRLMRERNLDIAAITDHASGDKMVTDACMCDGALGLSEGEWQQLKEFADDENAPDQGFIAIRGFEWSGSVPNTGHMNVWFTERWTDPVATASVGHTGAAQFAGQGMAEEIGENSPVAGEVFGEVGHRMASEGGAVGRQSPTSVAAMAGAYDWLMADPARVALGGGNDGIAGFNHPGREAGRFGQFAFNADMEGRIVSLEVFNRREDYLFEGLDFGQPSPIVQCLNNGWKVGLNGVTDEHGDDEWGLPRDKGRMGLWLPAGDFGRDTVKEAMRRRSFFATNRWGFRLDVMATDAAGTSGYMGEDMTITQDRLTFSVDIDGNDPEGIDNFRGRTLNVQVLSQGDVMPTVLRTVEVTVPDAQGDPITIPDVALDGSPYVFLRVCDPAMPEDGRAQLAAAAGFRGVGGAIAYSSPFYVARG